MPRALLRATLAVCASLLLLLSVSPAADAATTRPAPVYSVSKRLKPTQLKIMNYYPARASWSRMWTEYSHRQASEDFAAIASLGANTVRIVVQPHAVGWPNVTPAGAAVLKDMIRTAGRHGLRVELTLFDLWYEWHDIAGSKEWARQLLQPYRLDNRIAIVELQNEPLLDDDQKLVWAAELLPYLRELLPGVSRTLSANNPASVRTIAKTLPRSALDVIDVHLFGDETTMTQTLNAAHQVARGRPIIVGETGQTTAPEVGSDQKQVEFYTLVSKVTLDHGIRFYAPWTYTDFDLATMPAAWATPIEASFGLRRLDGTWKPAAAVVRAMYRR